jgi:hypothetical protein
MLQVIKIKETFQFHQSYFLGAHAIPEKYKENREEYIQLIINKMILKYLPKN